VNSGWIRSQALVKETQWLERLYVPTNVRVNVRIKVRTNVYTMFALHNVCTDSLRLHSQVRTMRSVILAL
jgi:hypothetical protein